VDECKPLILDMDNLVNMAAAGAGGAGGGQGGKGGAGAGAEAPPPPLEVGGFDLIWDGGPVVDEEIGDVRATALGRGSHPPTS